MYMLSYRMGSERIIVTDNGAGIHPSNYEYVALKHHTSKLSEFADLSTIMSLGFRGEAVSALCELSAKVTVSTRQVDQSVGSLLTFSPKGTLLSSTPVARGVGTTVVVDGLFESLPVRRKEFQRCAHIAIDEFTILIYNDAGP